MRWSPFPQRFFRSANQESQLALASGEQVPRVVTPRVMMTPPRIDNAPGVDAGRMKLSLKSAASTSSSEGFLSAARMGSQLRRESKLKKFLEVNSRSNSFCSSIGSRMDVGVLETAAAASRPSLALRINDASRTSATLPVTVRPEAPERLPASCQFVNGAPFRYVVLVILLANTWAMVLETEHSGWPHWQQVNVLFLAAYVVEFGLRMFNKSLQALLCEGSSRWWMVYDLLVICLGILDIFVSWVGLEPNAQTELAARRGLLSSAEDALRQVRRLLARELRSMSLPQRCLMLTRLLRVVRIVRMHRPLYGCVQLLVSMAHTFAWILSVIFVLCFALAIAMTGLLGHGILANSDDEENHEKIQELFQDVPTSLFTLFQLLTADDWSSISTPMVTASRLCIFFFIFFITFMSWTMLSLLTAVASETMISASSMKKQEDALEQEVQRNNFAQFLHAEFICADSDGNHVLDKEEFIRLMTQRSMVQQMITHGIQLKTNDLTRIWNMFDIDESGELTIDELVIGFSYLQENLAMKHVANVCYSLKHFGMQMDTGIDELYKGVQELDDCLQRIGETVTTGLELHQARWKSFLAGDVPELDEDETDEQFPATAEQNEVERRQTRENFPPSAKFSPRSRVRRILTGTSSPLSWL
mmetsp:Transcript_57227/g.133424  ORF Transcript_57227/g.133424 Transcript_57227/m.133424 type:complete len:646 (+) Transcript_57227:126-2063(+)